jgi:uncharacterized membrane protein
MAEPVNGANFREKVGDGSSAPNQIWSFRGYRLSPGEFNNAMIHFYRGEMTRANVWRNRIDVTTNWAVVTTGAALSFVFSEPTHSHAMIPLNTLLILLFLVIEARRYRYYELWAYRIRLMEVDFFAAMLAPPFQPSEGWATRMTDSLLHPRFKITFWEAFGRRFRRNYQYIFLLLALAWLVKIAAHPTPISTIQQFYERAAIGPISGQTSLLLGLVINSFIFAVGWLTVSLQEATGEVLPSSAELGLIGAASQAATAFIEGGIHLGRRPEQMAHIITTKGEAVGARVLHQLGRGVTALQGVGMYSGENRAVLLCAIHPDQIEDLKRIVMAVDHNAFVIIHPAQEVIGRGFRAPS